MELLGLLLPVVIDIVNRKIADKDIRFFVSVAICAAVGYGLNYLETGFHFYTAMEGFNSITKSIMATFGLAQVSYKTLWENSSLRQRMNFDAKN